VLEKIENWCSQQVAACKTEVVASLRVGSHMYDNVKNLTITYHIKEKEVFTLYGFPREISVSMFLIYVIDVECVNVYFPA
jgi:hypothetical protein